MTTGATIPAEMAQKLATPSVYATEEIHEIYSWLRANMPVARAHPEGFDPFWVVTRHADILAVSKANALFPSGARATTFANAGHIARNHEITGCPHLVKSLVTMDGPEHRKYRGLTQGQFMPAKLRERSPAIHALAAESVAAMAGLGDACDFAADISMAYPLKVVMEILGVPSEDYDQMLRLTQDIFGPQDPDTAKAMAALDANQYSAVIQRTVASLTDYFTKISDDRRARPRDDLATLIANAVIDGEPIGRVEETGYYIIVATAGHDTTASSISGVMWALATVPGLLDQVRADMSLLPQLIEEAIRWVTPVKTFMRSAAEDTEIGGQAVGKGDWIMLAYASGNRDETVFEEPFSFRVDRKPNPQLAFGFGGHTCLGQHMARLEMQALYEALLPRLESVELNGEPEYIQSIFVNGLKRLPIRFRMR
ncbi:cytochrome P450 [Sphingopyxis sp.]|uniref:cytochrome P450 n=1 Tax=Sphingopyxis sp. TaxID=1908224 RepID=UPI002B4956A2|nr:cytochrome P450 [Sphingopyxis sp.]HJS10529.1 cytochrome P450 [Sphingopyxis sp.]